MADNALESVVSIMALFADYASALDERRFEDWTELFCEQCHYEVQSKENWDLGLPAALIYCDSRDMIQDRVTVLKDTLTYPYLHSRHMITNIRIHGDAGGAYQVSANYLVLHTTEEGETRIYSTGKYQDEIVFTETGPKFLKKIVIADTSAINNLLAVPL